MNHQRRYSFGSFKGHFQIDNSGLKHDRVSGFWNRRLNLGYFLPLNSTLLAIVGLAVFGVGIFGGCGAGESIGGVGLVQTTGSNAVIQEKEKSTKSATSTKQVTASTKKENGSRGNEKGKSGTDKSSKTKKSAKKKMEIATFGNGCYWCTEAIFQRVKGVKKVTSGFMGGHKQDPTYAEVCAGTTGHAEVLHIEFDSSVVSYEKLLEVFWRTHDPTTLNRQGNDVGTQYRSAVFYHNDQQKELATKYKKKLGDAKAFDNPIVTEITKASKFYSAPDYHQNYYNLNKHKNPYCGLIQVKLDKFRKAFADVIDKEKDSVK